MGQSCGLAMRPTSPITRAAFSPFQGFGLPRRIADAVKVKVRRRTLLVGLVLVTGGGVALLVQRTG